MRDCGEKNVFGFFGVVAVVVVVVLSSLRPLPCFWVLLLFMPRLPFSFFFSLE